MEPAILSAFLAAKAEVLHKQGQRDEAAEALEEAQSGPTDNPNVRQAIDRAMATLASAPDGQ